MSNKQPPNPRRSFGDILNTNKSFNAIVEANSDAMQSLCAKNEHLLRLIGKSVYKQLRELYRQYGFNFSDQSYSCIRNGKRKTYNSVHEWVLASYWGMKPDELRALDITQDLSYIKPCIPTGK